MYFGQNFKNRSSVQTSEELSESQETSSVQEQAQPSETQESFEGTFTPGGDIQLPIAP